MIIIYTFKWDHSTIRFVILLQMWQMEGEGWLMIVKDTTIFVITMWGWFWKTQGRSCSSRQIDSLMVFLWIFYSCAFKQYSEMGLNASSQPNVCVFGVDDEDGGFRSGESFSCGDTVAMFLGWNWLWARETCCLVQTGLWTASPWYLMPLLCLNQQALAEPQTHLSASVIVWIYSGSWG